MALFFNIDEGYKIIQYIVNKTQSKYVSPADYQLLLNMVSMDDFNSYLPSKSIVTNQRKFESSQIITDALKPFKVPAIKITPDSNGVLAFPSDYEYLTAIRKRIVYQNLPEAEGGLKWRDVKVRMLDDDKLAGILSSSLVAPSLEDENLYCNETSQGIQLYPADMGEVYFSYIRTPVKIVYATTLVNGRAVYDSTHSTQWEFRNTDLPGMIVKICSYIGINMNSQQVIAYSEMKAKEDIQ